MKRLIIIFIISITVLFTMNGTGAFTFPWVDKDKSLLKSLKSNNLNKFKRLLKNGANPNTIFGENSNNWVMCLATKRGSIEFLKLAVENGGDINLRNRVNPVQTITSAPILCAITNHNMKAFDYLLEKDVDVSIHTYENAQPIPQDFLGDPQFRGKTLYGSPILHATALNEYCMALSILQRKELNWEESIKLKRSVEFSMVDPNSKSDKCRWEIIETLRQKGYEIDPERAMKENGEKRLKWKEKNNE